MKEFDYYIYIDYSENLIGYMIIEKEKIDEILLKIIRFRHYRNAKYKKLYLKNINKTIKKQKIKNYFYKIKIKEIRLTPEIYSDIIEFVSKHQNCMIFISVDDNQYNSFKKVIKIIGGEKVLIKRESELEKGTIEYQLSLMIDNLLNIERKKSN